MPTIDINVQNKIATAPQDVRLICGNSDYVIHFQFDTEWNEFEFKTARFIYNGKYKDVVFAGNDCPIPIIRNTYMLNVGVYAGELHTTTPACIVTQKSILCGTETEAEDNLLAPNKIIEAIEETNKEQLQSVEQFIDDETEKILAAIDQAVFDKKLLVDILAGTCENLSGDAITAIADYVFYNKTSLKTVDLPNCISVGASAFEGCTSMTTFVAPNMFNIGESAFKKCEYLSEINFPYVTEIPSYAFSNSWRLTSVSLPLVTKIPGNAFYYSEELRELNVSTLTEIGANAFYQCKSLPSSVLDLSNVTSLGVSAFEGCSTLSSVDLSSLTELPGQAFRYCTNLLSVYMPKVEIIGNSAFGCTFGKCTRLRKLFIPASCRTIVASSYTKSPFYQCLSSLNIFCEAASKPSGWGNYWNYYASGKQCTVHWGATYEDYEAY